MAKSAPFGRCDGWLLKSCCFEASRLGPRGSGPHFVVGASELDHYYRHYLPWAKLDSLNEVVRRRGGFVLVDSMPISIDCRRMDRATKGFVGAGGVAFRACWRVCW